MNKIITLLFLCVITISCKNDSIEPLKKKNPVLEKIGGSTYEDLIRTPVNADGSIDTANMAKISFDTLMHSFGTLNQDDVRKHTFTFTNEGTIDLVVLDVKSSCGCTIPSYSEEPIKPGEKGEINIKYDPKGKKGIQEKKVIVVSNTFPNKVELTIIADVIK